MAVHGARPSGIPGAHEMGRNWQEQPRDRRGRWYTNKRRDVRLDLRLSTAAADMLIVKSDRAGMTKTAFFEAAIKAFDGGLPPQNAPDIAPKGQKPGPDIFARHRAQLIHRKRTMR